MYTEKSRLLWKDVQKQLQLANAHLEEADKHLAEITEDELRKKPIKYVRGWLIDIYIARGEMTKAQDELENT